MHKHLIFVSLFVANCFFAFSQQISSFGNVDVIDSYYNPAFTAFENEVRGVAVYRHLQPSANSSTNGRFEELIMLTEFDLDQWNSGVGLKLHNEYIGLSHSRSVELNYRYQLYLNENTRFSLGFGGGYKDFDFDASGAVWPDGIPENFTIEREAGVNLNAGVGFSWKENLYLGASVMQLNEPNISLMNYTRHYALLGHYLFSISQNWQLQTQFLWLFNNNLNMLRVNIKSYHSDRFWWMINSGLNIQLMGAVGLRFWDKLDVGYGIDLFRNQQTKIFGGFFHEVVLSYRLRK